LNNQKAKGIAAASSGLPLFRRLAAHVAFSVVDRENVPAFGASVLDGLFLQKRINAAFFYFSEVADQTRAVTFAVAPVHAVEVAARHILALVAEANRVL